MRGGSQVFPFQGGVMRGGFSIPRRSVSILDGFGLLLSQELGLHTSRLFETSRESGIDSRDPLLRLHHLQSGPLQIPKTLLPLGVYQSGPLQIPIELLQLGVNLCPLHGHIAPSLQSDRFDRTAEDEPRAAIATISLFTVNRRRGNRTA